MLNPNLTEIELSKDEYQRYSRHIILPEVGLDGQKRLKAASILCVGTGGLGSPLLLYLAAAGVGRIGIVDFGLTGAGFSGASPVSGKPALHLDEVGERRYAIDRSEHDPGTLRRRSQGTS